MVVIYYFQALAEPDPNPNALFLFEPNIKHRAS